VLVIVIDPTGDVFLAKIAAELEQAIAQRALLGTKGQAAVKLLAAGPGWKVEDVVCTSGPQDRRFEEQHAGYTIAIVIAGTFQYRASLVRSRARSEVMAAGSLVLGNPGQCFECGHEHGAGDRCISFWYLPEYFERIAADAGCRAGKLDFALLRLPPLGPLSPLIARACAGLAGDSNFSWEELSLDLAARTIGLISEDVSPQSVIEPPAVIARVTKALRAVERLRDREVTVVDLAREAGLSPYHFLRTFQRLTGITPHQYVRRLRLRDAASSLIASSRKIVDIALDSGFGDVSNFNRAFKAEFGVSPRAFRLKSNRRQV